MTEQTINNETRKRYDKPKIKRIRLTLGDSVFGTGCKTATTGGGSGHTDDCLATTACSAQHGS
jgi:hypothetical protein